MNPLEELCQKWIEEELELRSNSLKWDSHYRWLARADTLERCRRELQESAGVVVTPEDSK